MKEIATKIQKKCKLTEQEKDDLLQKIRRARATIIEIGEALKDYQKEVKNKIEEQNDIIDECLHTHELGYIPQNIECTVKYHDGLATFFNADTGEIEDERPLTESEQLALTNNQTVIDAEDFIRNASKMEDDGEDD